jgi:hypothetical protein
MCQRAAVSGISVAKVQHLVAVPLGTCKARHPIKFVDLGPKPEAVFSLVPGIDETRGLVLVLLCAISIVAKPVYLWKIEIRYLAYIGQVETLPFGIAVAVANKALAFRNLNALPVRSYPAAKAFGFPKLTACQPVVEAGAKHHNPALIQPQVDICHTPVGPHDGPDRFVCLERSIRRIGPGDEPPLLRLGRVAVSEADDPVPCRVGFEAFALVSGMFAGDLAKAFGPAAVGRDQCCEREDENRGNESEHNAHI